MNFVLTCFNGESYDRVDYFPEATEAMQRAEDLSHFDGFQLHAVEKSNSFLKGTRVDNGKRINWHEEIYEPRPNGQLSILSFLEDEGVLLC